MTEQPATIHQWIQNAELHRSPAPEHSPGSPIPLDDRIDDIARILDQADGARPSSAWQHPVHLYAAAADLAQLLLDTTLSDTRQRLYVSCNLDFQVDLLLHLTQSCQADNTVTNATRLARPRPNNRNPQDWLDWAHALVEFTRDRAEAYDISMELTQTDPDFPPYIPDQIVYNCYTNAVSLAAAAARWGSYTGPAQPRNDE